MSWVFHEFFALEQGALCSCSSVGGGDLGPGCQSPNSATRAANQLRLGPRGQVNPFTGDVGTPPPGGGLAAADRRLTIDPADLDTTSLYLVETITFAPSETSSKLNNATHRPCTWDGGAFIPAGPSVSGRPAINAVVAQGYTLGFIDVPADGRIVVASRTFD